MDKKRDTKKPLGKFFLLSLKLQWRLNGWRSLILPVFDVVLAPVSILRSYILAQIINLVTAYITGRVATVFPEFWWLIGFIALVAVAEPASRSLQDYFITKLNTHAEYQLDRLLAERCAQLDAQYFEDPQFQDVLSRVQRLNIGWVSRNLSGILSDMITLTIASVAILQLNFVLFIMAVLSALPRLLSSFQTAGHYRKLRVALSSRRRLNWMLRDHLTQWHFLSELKPAGAIKSFMKHMVSNQNGMELIEVSAQKRYSIIQGISDMAGVLLTVVSRIWLLLRVITTKGGFGIGSYTFYDSLIARLENSSSSLVRNLRSIYEELINVEDFFIVMNAEPVVPHQPNATKLSRDGKLPSIEFRNVSFSYPGTTKPVLKNISFHLGAGQKMALIGVNGAGKTTIVKLLLRFYDPSEGAILIDGVDLRELDLVSWYDKLAVIQQDFNRYPLTVAQNISFDPAGKINRARLKNALDDAQANFVDDLPKAEQTVLTRNFDDSVDLSGGQWQKIALARAFYREADVLILDEPTSAIDARAELAIFSRLWHRQKDKGAIVISHRFSTVRDADLIVVVDNGVVVEQSNHALLMKKVGVYHELFSKQAKSYQ